MKLSYAMLEEGRGFVRNHDLEGLLDWIERSRVYVDLDATRKTFEQFFRAGNTRIALRIFDAAFAHADPIHERIVLVVQLVVWLFVILGLLGGLGALFRGCTPR